MTKQSLKAIANSLMIAFSAMFGITIGLTGTRWAIWSGILFLLFFVAWGILLLIFSYWAAELPDAPTKYRIKIESSDREIKYILEVKKPEDFTWSAIKIFYDMESAIAFQQELESKTVTSVQIIHLR